MSYIYLLGAILCEVTGTILLPVSKNFTRPIVSMILVIAYVMSFYLLTFALKEIPLAIAYATWAGMGIFLITLFGFLFYGESLQWQSIIGLILIAVGVGIVNAYKSQEIAS